MNAFSDEVEKSAMKFFLNRQWRGQRRLTMAALVLSLMVGCSHPGTIHSSIESKRIPQACLTMLRSSLTNEADIAMSDPRIPRVIRGLHPVDIQLHANDVVVTCSGRPSEYHLNRPSSEQQVWIFYSAGGKWGSDHKELLRISE